MTREAVRQRALIWLEGELDRWSALLMTNDTVEIRQTVKATLEFWEEDLDLATVRDSNSLIQLPERERALWEALWARHAELLDCVQAQTNQGSDNACFARDVLPWSLLAPSLRDLMPVGREVPVTIEVCASKL